MRSQPGSASFLQHVQLRESLRESDLAEIRSLVASTEMFSSAEVDVAVELTHENLLHGDQCGYWFTVAEVDGRVVGYAAYGLIPCTRSSYDLYWIAVQAAWQGRGLGKLVLAAAERRMTGAGGTRIYVDTSSRAAYAPTRRFYETCGYHVEATLPDFYAPGDGKVIFCKILA